MSLPVKPLPEYVYLVIKIEDSLRDLTNHYNHFTEINPTIDGEISAFCKGLLDKTRVPLSDRPKATEYLRKLANTSDFLQETMSRIADTISQLEE